MKKKQYRVKTEEEMIASFGEEWAMADFQDYENNRYRTFFAAPMDYLFGTVLDLDEKQYDYNTDGSVVIKNEVEIDRRIGGGVWSLTINQLVEISIKPTYTKRKITS